MSVEGSFMGVGKSQWALLVGFGCYQDWDKVFKNLHFQVHLALKDAQTRHELRRPCPLKILDDVGSDVSKYMVWGRKKEREGLSGGEYSYVISRSLQMIRGAVHGIIMTAPDEEDLAKVLRAKARLTAKLRWCNYYGEQAFQPDDRMVFVYEKRKYTNWGEKLVFCPPAEHFKINSLPSDIAQQYYDLKHEAEERIYKLTLEDFSSVDQSAKEIAKKQREDEVARVARLCNMGLNYRDIAMALTGNPEPHWTGVRIAEAKARGLCVKPPLEIK